MAAAPRPIALEMSRAGLGAFVAVNGDVQIGWCRRTARGWQVEDMDCNVLSGPFKHLDQAKRAGLDALAPEHSAENPGW